MQIYVEKKEETDIHAYDTLRERNGYGGRHLHIDLKRYILSIYLYI